MRSKGNVSFSVLDFDSNKVKKLRLHNEDVIEKKTCQREMESLSLAVSYLQRNPITLEGGVRVRVAEILDWDGGLLYLEYCEGINLEQVLRFGSKSEKRNYSGLLADFLAKCRERGFLWGDFAPRNMVFNERTKSLSIFDFEKKLDIQDCSQRDIDFSDFFRGYSFEELSCILDPENQLFVFGEIIRDRPESLVCAKDINSLRKRSVLSFYFEVKKEYLSQEVQYVEDIMSFVETPFNVGGFRFFPIDVLEKLKRVGGYNEYAKIIGRLVLCRSCRERLNFLEKSFRRFHFNEVKGW